MAPGSAALADHPKTVNLREDRVVAALNGWSGHLFARENVDATAAALITTPPDGGGSRPKEAAKARLAQAEVRLRRLQAPLKPVSTRLRWFRG